MEPARDTRDSAIPIVTGTPDTGIVELTDSPSRPHRTELVSLEQLQVLGRTLHQILVTLDFARAPIGFGNVH